MYLEIGARCVTVSILQGPNQQTCRPILGCEAPSVTSFRAAIDLKNLRRIPQTETKPFVAVFAPHALMLLSKQGGREEESYCQAKRDLHDTSSKIPLANRNFKLCNRSRFPVMPGHSAVQLGKPRRTLDARFIGFEACRHVTRDSRETSYALARGLQGRLSQARAPLRVEEGLERRG